MNAIQWTNQPNNYTNILDFALVPENNGYNRRIYSASPLVWWDEDVSECLQVETKSGGMILAKLNDWIIKKSNNDFYVLSPEEYKMLKRKNKLLKILNFNEKENFGWIDWNTLSLDEMVKHLKDKFRFSSTGTAFSINKLIEFYEKNK